VTHFRKPNVNLKYYTIHKTVAAVFKIVLQNILFKNALTLFMICEKIFCKSVISPSGNEII
jgi:hypothetical protein